jgi:hypothetical protein
MDVVARPGLTGAQAEMLRLLASALMDGLELRLARKRRLSTIEAGDPRRTGVGEILKATDRASRRYAGPTARAHKPTR